MAITGSYTTSTGVNFNLKAYYSYTQDVAANTSTVTITLKLSHNKIDASALSGSYLSVAGNKVTYSKHIYQGTYGMSETTLATKTVTITHNSAGQGECSIKAAFVFNGTYGGKYIGTLTLSETLTLQAIPRASGLSVPNSMNTGESLKATISPSSSSFQHKVQYIIGSTTMYTSGFIAAGTTSYTYTIPHSWSPDDSSKTMIVRLYTYNSNGTFIASTDKTITINVPANIIPSITSLTADILNGLNNNYVQGKSKIKFTVDADPGSGSTITNYYYRGKNISGSNTSYTSTSSSQTSGTIQSYGNLTYDVRVKDTRDRYSDWASITIYVEPYSTPKISSIQAQRCLADGTIDGNGTYAKVTVKTTHSSINWSNTATVTLTSSKDEHSASEQIISSAATTNTYSNIYGNGFAIDTSYEIKATIIDEYNATHNLSVLLQAAQRSLNISKYGNGVAIGGMSTVKNKSDDGLFECNWDTEINANLAVTNNITTDGNFGGTSAYNSKNFAMFCQWADENNHDILVRGQDGLTMGLGWKGNDTYPTVLDVRPTQVNMRGTMTAPRGRFTATTDANSTTQENVPLRIGDPINHHIDMDVNEIIAKKGATELAELYMVGSALGLYSGSNLTMTIGEDSTGAYVQSLPSYTRTNSGSPNMHITSYGTFCRTTSSSERYKTNIKDVSDEDLNPYSILNIPVKQFEYNDDNIPSDKKQGDTYIGLIAEDVEKFYPVAAEYNEDGQVEMWNIKVLFPALLKIVQDQQKEIDALKAEIDAMKK